MIWVGFIKAAEGCKRTKNDLPEQKEFCQQTAFGLIKILS